MKHQPLVGVGITAAALLLLGASLSVAFGPTSVEALTITAPIIKPILPVMPTAPVVPTGTVVRKDCFTNYVVPVTNGGIPIPPYCTCDSGYLPAGSYSMGCTKGNVLSACATDTLTLNGLQGMFFEAQMGTTLTAGLYCVKQ